MSNRGRPRKANHLHLAAGNPGNRPLPDNPDGKAPARAPAAPAVLDAEGKKHWRLLVKQLTESQTLATMDLGALTVLCATWSEMIKAMKERKGKLTLKTVNENTIQHPLLAIERKARETYIKDAQQFGLTPASRTKVTKTKPESDHGDQL